MILLLVVVAPIAVTILAVLPIMEARDSAAHALSTAQQTRDWVAGQVRAYPANADDVAGGGVPEVIAFSLSEIEESLIGGGLRDVVSQLSDRDDGGIDLAFDNAPFDLLGAWLDSAQSEWGHDIRSFRIDAVSPGLVNARLELEPSG